MKYKMTDFDFVFLSYDEPNAEILYADLLSIVPWSKRVHGIKGFDTAHRECANVSDTNFFITIDGDNKIYSEFLDQEIEIDDSQHNHAWTWAGRNYINGLVYGNGGLKLWSKEFVRTMNSHENADSKSTSVDFCWSSSYHETLGCYSTSITNSSPLQAWRSGFREGTKMSLDQGHRVLPTEFNSKLWFGNINRLCIWSTIGQDVENGIWAIYGARLGCYMTVLTDWDYSEISNYDKVSEIWNSVSSKDPIKESIDLGDELNKKIGLDITMLSDEHSKFFKRVYMNPPRPWMGTDTIKHFMALKHV